MIQKYNINLIALFFVLNLKLVICLINDDLSNVYSDYLNSNNTNDAEIFNNKSTTNHVCYRKEIYTEQVRIPVKQPVRIRSSNWCLEFPPRCSNYKTEIREVIKVQNISRTHVVEFCCEGYTEIIAGNEKICKPICRGGCGKGFCNAPNECTCDIGYTGRHCTQRCQHGKWGENCQKICKCRNNSFCDSTTGICQCQNGWTGELCDQSCPNGFYGLMCKNICECSSNRCNPQTGECILEEMITKLKPVERTTISSLYTTSLWNSELTNFTENLKETKKQNETEDIKQKTINSPNLIIETLNSTIANLTENIDKLTKNLGKNSEPVTLIAVPENIFDNTTQPSIIKSIPDVIVINPVESSNPAVIIHQPNEKIPILPISKTPEIIHVIANLKEPLNISNLNERNHEMLPQKNNYDWIAILSIIAIFIVLIILSGIGFIILYRNYFKQQLERNSTISQQNENNQESKICAKPLPDLPAFTQILKRTEAPQFYDRPSNNSVVPQSLHPYYYKTANGSIYSETSKSYARKHSLEHLYDEIKYPTIHSTTSRL